MQINVGKTDRIIRLTLATALFMLGFMGPWNIWVSAVLVIIGIVMLVVGITRKCPIFSILGWNSCEAGDLD